MSWRLNGGGGGCLDTLKGLAILCVTCSGSLAVAVTPDLNNPIMSNMQPGRWRMPSKQGVADANSKRDFQEYAAAF